MRLAIEERDTGGRGFFGAGAVGAEPQHPKAEAPVAGDYG